MVLQRRDCLFFFFFFLQNKKFFWVFLLQTICFAIKKCALPTIIAVKKPLYYSQVCSMVMKVGKTDAWMAFFRCTFQLLGSHINTDCTMCSILFAEPVPAVGDHTAMWLWRDNRKAKGIEMREGKRVACKHRILRRGISSSLKDFQHRACRKFSSTSKLARNSFQELLSVTHKKLASAALSRPGSDTWLTHKPLIWGKIQRRLWDNVLNTLWSSASASTLGKELHATYTAQNSHIKTAWTSFLMQEAYKWWQFNFWLSYSWSKKARRCISDDSCKHILCFYSLLPCSHSFSKLSPLLSYYSSPFLFPQAKVCDYRQSLTGIPFALQNFPFSGQVLPSLRFCIITNSMPPFWS